MHSKGPPEWSFLGDRHDDVTVYAESSTVELVETANRVARSHIQVAVPIHT